MYYLSMMFKRTKDQSIHLMNDFTEKHPLIYCKELNDKYKDGEFQILNWKKVDKKIAESVKGQITDTFVIKY